ncbi:MAG: thioesterase family protein [Pseudomonadota bacterium]
MSGPSFPILSTDALRAEGVDPPWTFGIADTVRFSELDVLNHANNAAYIGWLENARIAYFVHYGISDYVSEDRPTLVVRGLQIDFHAPLLLGERYVVTARSVEYGRTSWKMAHAICRDGVVCADALCTIVTVGGDPSRPVPLPQSTIEAIAKRDGAQKRR